MSQALAIPPNRDIDFGFGCDCVACVRACERAKLRARDDSSVAGAGRANLWGASGPSGLGWSGPSVHPAILNKKFEQ